MAVWTQKYIDALPKSSFAWIDPEGNGHLPYKDENGKVDLPHVKDALSRLDQTAGIPESEKGSIRVKLQNALKQSHAAELGEDLDQLTAESEYTLSTIPITANQSGQLPTRFPLLTTFDLPNSNRGHFKVTTTDLRQIKEKFDAGIAFPSSDTSTGLAVDFEHKGHKEAGAWIHALDVVPDTNAADKATLFADNTEWTTDGAEAVRGGTYKMVSPTGAFGRRNGKLTVYPHHANLTDKLSNVLMGAGLTNEPFQNMMAPIRLSVNGDDVEAFVNDKNKENTMVLDELIVMDREKLSVPQLDFLTENQDKLSEDVRKKFKLEESSTGDQLSAEDKATLEAIKSGDKKVVAKDSLEATPEERDMLAAIKSGEKKVVDATVLDKLDKLDGLEKTAEQYRTEKAEQLVHSHVLRGALKPDQEKETVTMLLSAVGPAREQLEKHLGGLPSNELVAGEIGHDKDVNVDTLDELKQKTLKLQADSKEKGQELSYGQAQAQLLSQDKDLSARYDDLRKEEK